MKIIEPSHKILTTISRDDLELIALASLAYFMNEDVKITHNSSKKIIKDLIKKGDETALSCIALAVEFICDQATSKIFNQSNIHCSISNIPPISETELVFIKPCFWANENDEMQNQFLYMWKIAMGNAEDMYLYMIKNGATAEKAYSVLPNSIKTKVTVVGDYRQWRQLFNTNLFPLNDQKTNPQVGELLLPLLRELNNLVPEIFQDIYSKWLKNQSDSISEM